MSALSSVIDDFATGTYTVTRRAPGSLSAGRYTPGAASTFSAVMSVQPASSRDQVVLPSGLHYEDTVVAYSATELRAVDSSTGAGDTFVFRGETYKVFAVEGPWAIDGSTHYVARAARQVTP